MLASFFKGEPLKIILWPNNFKDLKIQNGSSYKKFNIHSNKMTAY